MMWLRKSKKGFTLVELMVVVAIIGILALLGLRLFLLQQIRAKNAIVKANAATVHTIIQGNLADDSFADAGEAVDSVGTAAGTFLTAGEYDNLERPAGMKNPHLTAEADLVVLANEAGFDTTALLVDPAYTGDNTAQAGIVIVAHETGTANKFYILGLDQNGEALGEVYVATK